jgi:hypothetical protein
MPLDIFSFVVPSITGQRIAGRVSLLNPGKARKALLAPADPSDGLVWLPDGAGLTRWRYDHLSLCLMVHLPVLQESSYPVGKNQMPTHFCQVEDLLYCSILRVQGYRLRHFVCRGIEKRSMSRLLFDGGEDGFYRPIMASGSCGSPGS